MKRIIIWAALVYVGILTFASGGKAGKENCPPSPSPPQAYATAASVFIGKVKTQGEMFSMTTVGCIVDKMVTFTVDKPYFGVADKELTIYNTVARLEFKEGETYLVYAYHDKPSGGLMVFRACSRTRLLTEAQKDLLFLDDPAGMSAGVTISGRVFRQGKATPLEGIKVQVHGNGRNVDLVTNEEGKYSVGGLGAGEYKIKVKLPWRLKAKDAPRVVSVADRGLVEENFVVRSRFAW